MPEEDSQAADPRGLLPAVRVAWGAVLLATPTRVLRVFARDDRPESRAVIVLRVLGARHLLQAALESVAPRPAVLWLAAGTDSIHAVTALALAVLDARWRRGALVDAAIAGAFGVADAVAAGRGSGRAGRARPGPPSA